MNSHQSLQSRISAQSDALSPKLRRAAIYVAEHPEEVAMRSLRHLAGETGLTPPTFSRLANALGFQNYEKMREECRESLRNQQLTYAEKARALQEENEINTHPKQGVFIMRQGLAAIDNIHNLLNSVDTDELETVAAHLASARTVLLVGLMSSYPFVNYMKYMASMAFDNWNVLSLNTGSLASAMSGLNEADVVFVISKSPYVKLAIDTARRARETGATIIGITDGVLSPLSTYLDITLVVSTDSPQFFSSHIASLLLIESIIGMTVARSGDDALKRIADVEANSHQFGEYWPN